MVEVEKVLRVIGVSQKSLTTNSTETEKTRDGGKMDNVSIMKTEVRTSRWLEVVRRCQDSGMTARSWCECIMQYMKIRKP